MIMKVLIVDDNERVRWVIKMIIEDLVDQFYECADGAMALASYTAFRPDWVLMDIKMKDIDGIFATREIKQAFIEAKIMIVTDYDDVGLRKAALSAGAREYVLKEDLVALRRILQGREIS